MAGVEPNPGPDRLYDYWSRDTSRYLWPTIGLMDASMSGRIKRLLKYFDPRTKGGKLVYAGVGATMAASVADLKERYFPTLTGDFTDEHRWDCIKKNLDSLLPAVSALDAEAELKRMTKDAKESLLQFICRFQTVADDYTEDQLNPQRAAHILLRKLPQAFQMRMATERLESLSVGFIY